MQLKLHPPDITSLFAVRLPVKATQYYYTYVEKKFSKKISCTVSFFFQTLDRHCQKKKSRQAGKREMDYSGECHQYYWKTTKQKSWNKKRGYHKDTLRKLIDPSNNNEEYTKFCTNSLLSKFENAKVLLLITYFIHSLICFLCDVRSISFGFVVFFITKRIFLFMVSKFIRIISLITSSIQPMMWMDSWLTSIEKLEMTTILVAQENEK